MTNEMVDESLTTDCTVAGMSSPCASTSKPRPHRNCTNHNDGDDVRGASSCSPSAGTLAEAARRADYVGQPTHLPDYNCPANCTTSWTMHDNCPRDPGAADDSRALQRRPSGRRAAGDTQARPPAIARKFQKLDEASLSSAPAPDVKIGQRVAYKEYYGNEFGTIRWIGRVPQISADWTVGVEFDNAIGEGDGSLHGRRYFIAKDCFAKFLPLDNVALVDQHVGRPEPGTMISVMSAAVRPGQMISIQRVSTVHVQHCFLNAPHRPQTGAEFLAVNTRLHCQCPNCGPCAHVVKPPSTQRLRTHKNATHMCQFSTYTCCGMESSDEALCTYTGNKISALPPPTGRLSSFGLPPIGGSWIEGAGYLTNLQAEQRKLMPEEYRLGAAPEDVVWPAPSATQRKHSTGHRHAPSSEPAATAEPTTTSDTSRPTRHHRHAHHHKHRLHDRAHHHEHRHAHQSHAHTPVYYTDQQEQSASPAADTGHSDQQLALVATSDKGAQFVDEPPPLPPETVTAKLVDISPTRKPRPLSTEPAAGRAAKWGRVLHRDSIENRYLFPTDDYELDSDGNAIESALEADLEDLSQARYGYLAAGPNGANGLSASGGSRLKLFKSLRSLVFCLSGAKSNQPASNISDRLHGSRHSENTMCFYERPHEHHLNKSMPAECCISTSTGEESRKSHEYEYGDGDDEDDNCDYDVFPSSPRKHNNSNSSNELAAASRQMQMYAGTQALPCHEYPHHYPYGGRNFATGTMNASATTTTTVRRHISSSSDCGFSSASQNSINLASYPSCSPSGPALDDERRRMEAVYRRIAARVVSSAAGAVSAEDLIKLKRTLFEMQPLDSASCCAHQCSSAHQLEPAAATECEQVIADIIKKSYFEPTGESTCGESPPPPVGQNSGRSLPQRADEASARCSVELPSAGSQSETALSLPKAFELKLTLSINSDDSTKRAAAAESIAPREESTRQPSTLALADDSTATPAGKRPVGAGGPHVNVSVSAPTAPDGRPMEPIKSASSR